MNRKNFFKLAIITLAIGVLLLVFTYFFYHFATDAGLSLVWHKEIGKPFVTNLFGIFGVLFVWASVMSFLIGLVFFEKEK